MCAVHVWLSHCHSSACCGGGGGDGGCCFCCYCCCHCRCWRRIDTALDIDARILTYVTHVSNVCINNLEINSYSHSNKRREKQQQQQQQPPNVVPSGRRWIRRWWRKRRGTTKSKQIKAKPEIWWNRHIINKLNIKQCTHEEKNCVSAWIYWRHRCIFMYT